MEFFIKGLLLVSCLHVAYSRTVNERRLQRVSRQVEGETDRRIVCYYADWAPYRTDDSKFTPDDIHPNLCTHIHYAFATVGTDSRIIPFDENQDIRQEGYNKTVNLKKENPNLKVVLGVGGTKEGSMRFSKLSADPRLRSNFARSCLSYLRQFNFDGVDIDWQYPNFTEGSSFADKDNYVLLLKDLREVLKDDFIISMNVPALASLIDRGFNLNELSKYVNYMNVLSYNYHMSTEPEVGALAALYPIPEDPVKETNVDYTIGTYLRHGVDPSKLNMGIPLYGLSFNLEDPEQTDIGSGVEDEGTGTQETGAIFYNTLCKRIQQELWTVKHINKSAVGPYAYKDKHWVSYDDMEMIKTKARYALDNQLGGLMFWTIDMDDFKGQCHMRSFPLIKAGREAFLSRQRPSSSSSVRPPVITDRPSVDTEKPTSSMTRRPETPKPPRKIPPIPNGDVGLRETGSNEPFADTETDLSNVPGNKTFYSNRDILFQNVKIWISNHYYPPQ